MAVKYTQGNYSNNQSRYSQAGVEVIGEHHSFNFHTRVVHADIDCLSRIPNMLHKCARRGEQVLPCLALLDIDGTIIDDNAPWKTTPIPPKTIDTTNWLLSQRDIQVIAITSRRSDSTATTERHLKKAGIALISNTNPNHLDGLTETIKDQLDHNQKDGFKIKKNVVYTSGEDKGSHVELIIKALEKNQKLTFGSVVFADNTQRQAQSVAEKLDNAHYTGRKSNQIQFSCYLNAVRHSPQTCTCEVPEHLTQQTKPEVFEPLPYPRRRQNLCTIL